MKKKPKLYYGWIVALTSFFATGTTAGTIIYGFSIFVSPVTSELGLTATSFVFGMTLATVYISLLSPLSGKLIEKKGLRFTTVAGGLIIVVGYLILSFANDLPIFYIGYSVIGIGGGITGPVVGTSVAAKWFSRRRGLAQGFISAGNGIAGMILAPVLARCIISFGYAPTYLVMAAVIVVFVCVLGGIFMRDDPSDLGLYPDGDPAPLEAESKSADVCGLTLRQSMKTGAFWALGLGTLFLAYAQMGTMQTYNPFVQSIGFDPLFAAALVSLSSITAAITKILFGFLVDKLPLKVVTAIGLGCQALGCLLLYFVGGQSGELLIYAFIIVFSFSLGAWHPLLTIHSSGAFGIKFFPSVFGVIFLMKGIGDTLGPITASIVYDVTGTYTPIYLVFAIMSVAVTLTFLLYKKPKLPSLTKTNQDSKEF